jgi:hypothetical protein
MAKDRPNGTSMTRKRAVWAVGIAVIGFLAGLLWLSGASQFALLLLSIGVYDRMFPQRISWDAKNAWLKCPAAIADEGQWPATPRDACEAMYLCVNEGALSELKMQTLFQQISKTRGATRRKLKDLGDDVFYGG